MMKNLLSKSFLGAAALVLGLTLVFSQSAFKTHDDPVVYQYTNPSANETAIRDILNWEVVDGGSPSCGESGSLVCRYTFEGDIDDFETFLSDHDNTIADINLNATSKKLAP